MFRCTVAPTLNSESDVYLLAEHLKALRPKGTGGPQPALSLTLQSFSPADPMDPALKKVKPFTEEALSRMQVEVNRILA
jgi:hypothetical protein